MEMLMTLDNFTAFVDGLDHPEGVAWGQDGYVYAGGESGQLYRVHPETGDFFEIANTGGFILGLCFDGSNNLYACDLGNKCIQKITPEGDITVYSKGSIDRALAVPNYPVFDAAGNLYVSDSGGWHEYNGCIFRIDKEGVTEVINTSLDHFPNGLAISPDGAWLYVAMSNKPSVFRLALNADGSVGEPEKVVDLPQTVPDGLAFDVENNLYVSCYTPDRIYRVSPNGQVDILIDDWESTRIATPTNIAFGGDDLKTLFIASLGRWHLAKGEMPIAGSKLFYPIME